MKLLIIYGSPRKGNSWEIVSKIKSKLLELSEEIEFDEIYLKDYQIDFCKGCYICFEHGEDKCPHFNQINPIVSKIKSCDGLIITSPVYVMQVTAMLKNLFDHMAYFYHRPYFFTKKAIAISTTGGAGVKDTINYMEDNLHFMGFNKVYKIPVVISRSNEEKLNKKIDSISNSFYNDIKNNKIHSPTFKDIFYHTMWRAMSGRTNALKKDKEYWQSTGLKYHDFAPEVKLPLFKRIFTKCLYSILSHVFK